MFGNSRQEGVMKNISRFSIRAVLVAGVMFAGGVAEAASPSAQKVCVNKATGVMRYLRKTGKQTCERSEVKLIWNKSGVAGATGATGATGAIGPSNSYFLMLSRKIVKFQFNFNPYFYAFLQKHQKQV